MMLIGIPTPRINQANRTPLDIDEVPNLLLRKLGGDRKKVQSSGVVFGFESDTPSTSSTTSVATATWRYKLHNNE